MNIFHKVALQGLRKNRTRTFVTVIGVILSAAMVTAVATFGVSLLYYLEKGAEVKYGGWHAAFLNVDSAFVQARSFDEEAANTAAFQDIGYAALDGAKNPDRPYAFLAGFCQETFDALPMTLLSGRFPENSGEILISAKTASDGGVSYALGDTATLAVGSRMDGKKRLGQKDPYQAGKENFVVEEEQTYTVVGICRTPVFEEDFSPGYTFITKVDTIGTEGYFSVFVTLKEPRRVHDYVDSVAGGHACILNNNVLRFMGISDEIASRIFFALLYAVGGIVVAIIMIGSVFLIYNSFSISLNERMQQMGIFSSVGATAKQLRNSVLFEGLCIGAVGIPAGILVGVGSIGLVMAVVSRNFQNILYDGVPLTIHLSGFVIVGAAAVSMVTILVSAYLPAKKAANMPVMDCIRQTNETKLEAEGIRIPKLAQYFYGLEGLLALKNFKRNRKRYRSIVFSLVLSIVLFISTSAFVGNLEQSMAKTMAFTTYDIGFGTQDMGDDELLKLYSGLKTVTGVTKSACQSVRKYGCTVPADMLSEDYLEKEGGVLQEESVELQMEIQFMDDSAYRSVLKSTGLPVREYTGENAKVIVLAKMEIGSDERKGEKEVDAFRNLFKEDSVEAVIAPQVGGRPDREHGQHVSLSCVEIVAPDIPPANNNSPMQDYYLQAIVPWELQERFAPDGISPDILVKGMTFSSENPSQSVAEMQEKISNAGIASAYILLNTTEVMEENRNYIFIANVFAYTFIIFISLIAVANVFNTISTNIKLRRRELAMLRSVGMSDRDFNKMMRWECVFYGIRALFAGLPLAVAISWLIYKGMFAGGADEIVFVMPWASIGISICSVLLVIFVTMMYAVSKIKKENIIDALRDDMT